MSLACPCGVEWRFYKGIVGSCLGEFGDSGRILLREIGKRETRDRAILVKGRRQKMLFKACGLHVVVEVKLRVAVLGLKRD